MNRTYEMKIEEHEIFNVIIARLMNGDYKVSHTYHDFSERVIIDFKFGWMKYFRFEIESIRGMDESNIKRGALDAKLSVGFLIPYQYVDVKDIPPFIINRVLGIMTDRVAHDGKVHDDARAAHLNKQLSKL